jgi:hypothetical protein
VRCAATRDIARGEELLRDYGTLYWEMLEARQAAVPAVPEVSHWCLKSAIGANAFVPPPAPERPDDALLGSSEERAEAGATDGSAAAQYFVRRQGVPVGMGVGE